MHKHRREAGGLVRAEQPCILLLSTKVSATTGASGRNAGVNIMTPFVLQTVHVLTLPFRLERAQQHL